MGVRPARSLITQNARFDPWKDPLGLIAAYRLARKRRRVFSWLWRGPWPWTTPRARGSTARSRPRAKQTRSSTIYCERPLHRAAGHLGRRVVPFLLRSLPSPVHGEPRALSVWVLEPVMTPARRAADLLPHRRPGNAQVPPRASRSPANGGGCSAPAVRPRTTARKWPTSSGIGHLRVHQIAARENVSRLPSPVLLPIVSSLEENPGFNILWLVELNGYPLGAKARR